MRKVGFFRSIHLKICINLHVAYFNCYANNRGLFCQTA